MRLVKPSIEIKKEILDYKNEMILNGEPKVNGGGSIERYNDFNEWLKHLDSYSDKTRSDFNNNFVEGSQFLLINEDNRVLGMINVRHYLNDFLMEYGGHIGYSIRPSERKKGYGKVQLMLAIEFLNSINVNEILITCDDTNIASIKTILSCNGVLENKVLNDGKITRRYWIRK